MKNTQEIARDIFKRYPDCSKIFITSDGQAFFNEHDAKNHAVGNRKKEELSVEPVLRSELKDNFEVNLKELSDFDTESEKPDYKKVRRLVERLNLKVVDFKTPTLLDALRKAKVELIEKSE